MPGRIFFRSLPFPSSFLLSAVTRLAGTQPPERAIRSTLTTGLEETQIRRILEEFDPESEALYRHAVGARIVPPHRGYIQTSNDREMSTALQQKLAHNLDARWTSTLQTVHLPMLEQPDETAHAIRDFLAQEVV